MGRLRTGFAALALVVLVTAQAAHAFPADAQLWIAPDADRLLPVDFQLEGAFVDPPGALEVEAMQGASEVYVRAPGGAPRSSTLFAYSAYRLHAWSVCVAASKSDCPPPTPPTSVAKSCPGFGPVKEDGETFWAGAIKTDACLAALRKHLPRSDVSARSLRLVLEEAPARTLFGEILKAAKNDPELAEVKITFLGPTLALSGRAPRRAFERLLLTAWAHAPGSLSFDADDLEVTPTPTDDTVAPVPTDDFTADSHPSPDDVSDVQIIEVP